MIDLIYVDLFCGGGGTTTGVHNARVNGQQCAIVAACINHDENAIRSHKSNHKQTLHFTEDITLLYNTLRMQRLVEHVNRLRALYPEARVVLWASLECTNFSKAKGGQAREADSRTLANHLFPYIEALNPDIIQIENVEEFMSWGPLDENGKQISKNAGEDYIRWINAVQDYGYKFEYRILNAADFGAYTSRKRFFGQFVRLDEEIYWPEQTHAEKPENRLFGERFKKWNAVREVLDFSDEGESIFDRKKPLVDATLRRIYAGLIKFVAGGQKAFLVKYNSMSQKQKYIAPDIDKPCPVVSTQGRLGIGSVQFLSKAYSGHPESKNISTEGPSGAVTTKDHHQLVNAQFLASYYGNGNNISSIEKPSPTVVTKDRISLIQTRFIDQQFGNGRPADINNPLGTITTIPKYNLTQVKSHYLLNPQFQSEGASIDRPCFTLIARMDKRPPYLINVDSTGNLPSFIVNCAEGLVYQIYDNDSEISKKIKEFMCLYGISDIKMRMLRIPELKKIMGFPEDYILIGTQADQKKFIGNAVEVHMATAIVEATAKGLKHKNIAA